MPDPGARASATELPCWLADCRERCHVVLPLAPPLDWLLTCTNYRLHRHRRKPDADIYVYPDNGYGQAENPRPAACSVTGRLGFALLNAVAASATIGITANHPWDLTSAI